MTDPNMVQDIVMKVLQMMNGGAPDAGADLAMLSVDNSIQPWSAKKVMFGGSGKGKDSVVDKAWMQRPEEMDMGAALPGVDMSGAEGENPFLSTMSRNG
jgi:hypothetical protein